MKIKIVYINVLSHFGNTTRQETIKREFQKVFVLFKVQNQSIIHTRIES